MPNVQTNKYGDVEEDSPCWNCENAYVEDIWLDWMCRAKECPYQKERMEGEANDKIEQIEEERFVESLICLWI